MQRSTLSIDFDLWPTTYFAADSSNRIDACPMMNTAPMLFADLDRCPMLYLQGWQHHESGHVDAALRAFQEVLITGRQHGHQGWIRAAENAILAFYVQPSNLPIAVEKVIDLAQFELAEQCAWAAALYHNGRLGEAETVYRRGLEAAVQINHSIAIAACLNGLGLICLERQHYSQAQAHCRTAVEVLSEVEVPAQLAIAQHNLGLALFHQENYLQAKVWFQAALNTWQLLDEDSLEVATTLKYLGQTYAHLKEFWFALGSFEAALDVLYDMSEHPNVYEVAIALLLQMAALCQETHHRDIALSYLLSASLIAPSDALMVFRILIQQQLAQQYQRENQGAIALSCYSEIAQTVFPIH